MKQLSEITGGLLKSWGSRPAPKQKFNQPKWARLRMFVQYYEGNAKYPSFDYTYAYPNGIKTKIKSESVGLTKLFEAEERIRNIKGRSYRYINIFCNLTNNLDTVTGNFDYHIATIVNGAITWKNPVFYKKEDCQMFDIKRMAQYMEDKKQLKIN
jgi:hypothetical protein